MLMSNGGGHRALAPSDSGNPWHGGKFLTSLAKPLIGRLCVMADLGKNWDLRIRDTQN
jgi:hypothetical protein